MATSYTSLLGLALPVTGELAGTWGDTVNNSITSLLDTAVAGTTTLSSDADVTLSTITGASNQARQAVILWTASGSTTRNITAPAQSKAYIVINATGGTQSIVIRGVGPTTGVTIPPGIKALVVWNGSDFIAVAYSAPRVVAIANATSITMNADTTDVATQDNSQAVGTLTVNAPSGTPYNGQRLILRLQSTNVQTFSWNAIFAGSSDLLLPTTSSGGSKDDYMGFMYNSTATKWQLVAKVFGF